MDKTYILLRYYGLWYVVPHWLRASMSEKELARRAVYSSVTKRRAQDRISKLNRIEAAKEVLRG